MSKHRVSFELIIIIGKRLIFDLFPFSSKLWNLLLIHFDFWGFKSQGFHKVEIEVTGEGSKNPEEWLFVLIVRFGWNIEVLKVSLSVEGNLSSFDFSVLLVNFITNQDDGDVVTDSSEILIPLGNVLVSNSSGDVEHENSSVGSNVISFSETTEFFLTGSIPKTELNGSVVSVEGDRANFNTLSSNVFFLEFTSLMSLNKGGLSNSTVSDENNFEFGYWFWSLC
jgi:hypothetical protein